MKYKLLLVIISILVLLLYLIDDSGTFINIQRFGIIGIVTLVISIMSWLSNGNRLLSPYIIFLLVLYVFSYGVPMLYAFGVEPERDLEGYLGITKQQIYDSQFWTLQMLIFFQLGGLCCPKGSYVEYKNNSVIDKKGLREASRLKKAGWFLAVISCYFYLDLTIKNLILSAVSGYGALYEGEMATGFGTINIFLANLFIPALICLYVVYRKNKKIRFIITGLFAVNIVAGLAIGGRTGSVTMIAMLLILYDSLIRRFKRRDYVIIISVGFVFASLLSYIAQTRTSESRSFDSKDVEVSSNAVFDAISEMGGTQSCLIETMQFVPNNEPFKLGKSYLFSITTIIPNLGFWDIHPAKKESNLGDWLTDKLGLSYGTGYSMTAEAYINFGSLCFVVFFLWGMGLARFYGFMESCVKKQDDVYIAVIMVFFWLTLGLPRSSFISLIRPIFFYILPVLYYCKGSLKIKIK